MKRVVFFCLLFASPLVAQVPDDLLLRNVSGTAANPGGAMPHAVFGDPRGWSFFTSANVHVTYASETGPEEPRNEVFSTNWLTAGVQGRVGERLMLLARGRVSLEPYTMPDDSYPQILQWVPSDGGPLVDAMRPMDLVQEAAVQLAFRTTEASYLGVYAGLVGNPALGPVPFTVRESARDFAEAPFSYEVQEAHLQATNVVTAGFSSRWITLEGSVFHEALDTGDYTGIDSGDIDSRSARVTLTPTRNLAIQVSRGELGEEETIFGNQQREITSASMSWGTSGVAFTGMWTRRQRNIGEPYVAFGGELALRGARNTVMVRAESVDRPHNFPIFGIPDLPRIDERQRTSHFAVGYIYDFISFSRFRTGVGVNIDYHTNTHHLEDRYGHKPQTIYTFVRLRTR